MYLGNKNKKKKISSNYSLQEFDYILFQTKQILVLKKQNETVQKFSDVDQLLSLIYFS